MTYEYRYEWALITELAQALEAFGNAGWRLHTCAFDFPGSRVSLVWEREFEH